MDINKILFEEEKRTLADNRFNFEKKNWVIVIETKNVLLYLMELLLFFLCK
jgi:hypothetical protein